MADFDFTSFFNPAAWGSWSPAPPSAPPAAAPTVGAAPGAPMNIMSPAATAAAPPAPGGGAGANPLSGILGALMNRGTGGGTGAPGAPATPASSGTNMMQNLGMSLLKPQQMQAPQIQMARPVGPGQMPQAQPFGAQGFGAQPAMGSQRQLGMLGNYGF